LEGGIVKRLCQGLALAVFLAAPVTAFGQEAADEMKTQTQEPVVEAEVKEAEPSLPNTGRLSFSGGTDLVTDYYFRGILQENSGLILQPYATMYIKLSDETDEVKVTPYVGTWNSIHSEHTFSNPGGGPDSWYESDLIAGVDFSKGAFTLGLIYTAYTYPNGAFETIQEFGVKLAWDDTQYTEDRIGFALKPYAAIYAETSDGNGSEDWYAELGVAPSVYTFNKNDEYPISVSVPVTVGLSLKDYYLDADEEFFGFVSVGGVASVPLAFIPSDYGAWNLTGSVTLYWLGADGLQALNSDDEFDIVGKIGVAFAY
jgi:hypothetical protein